jgi:ComF family protein
MRLGMGLAKSVLELIYPVHCGGCGMEGEALCPACRRSFIALDSAFVCPRCGRWTGSDAVCGGCIVHPPRFTRGFYAFSFEGPLREAIHAFKFGGRIDVGRALMRMSRGKIASFADAFDVVIPLPVTEKRLKKRGFNQTFIMAEEISRVTGAPIDYKTLVKTKETKDQYMLSKEERKQNIRGVFFLKDGRRLAGRRLLLVDDLYTTGNTAAEACRMLLRTKAKEVLFFALARTP